MILWDFHQFMFSFGFLRNTYFSKNHFFEISNCYFEKSWNQKSISRYYMRVVLSQGGCTFLHLNDNFRYFLDKKWISTMIFNYFWGTHFMRCEPSVNIQWFEIAFRCTTFFLGVGRVLVFAYISTTLWTFKVCNTISGAAAFCSYMGKFLNFQGS